MRQRRRDLERALDAIAHDEALPQVRLEPDEIDELTAAIELRAGRPAAALPSQEFVTALAQQLREETDEVVVADGLRSVSRRALIAGAGVVAAGLAGAVVDRAVLPGAREHAPSPAAQSDLQPNVGAWQAVTTAAEVANRRSVRFDTPNLVGFVSTQGDHVVAVSGACTHLGCLLHDNATAGRLDCPCHRTAFGYDGRVLFSQLDVQPSPLPRVPARRTGDRIEVLLPRDEGSA